jgi:hypothetical protein
MSPRTQWRVNPIVHPRPPNYFAQGQSAPGIAPLRAMVQRCGQKPVVSAKWCETNAFKREDGML